MGEYYETFVPHFYPSFDKATSPLAKNVKAYERADDDVVKDLDDRYAGLHGVQASKVRVASERNVVTLTGSVTDAKVASFLAAIAANTLGVRDVINHLSVERAGAHA